MDREQFREVVTGLLSATRGTPFLAQSPSLMSEVKYWEERLSIDSDWLKDCCYEEIFWTIDERRGTIRAYRHSMWQFCMCEEDFEIGPYGEDVEIDFEYGFINHFMQRWHRIL